LEPGFECDSVSPSAFAIHNDVESFPGLDQINVILTGKLVKWFNIKTPFYCFKILGYYKGVQATMIFGSIENIRNYEKISPNFNKAIDYLLSLDLSRLQEGNFEVDGRSVYGFFKRFPLREPDSVLYESHKKYIDIQLLVRGDEKIFSARTQELKEKVPYDEQQDIVFHENAKNFVELDLRPGFFAVFFPDDAHKPCCLCGNSKESFKIVLKVAADK